MYVSKEFLQTVIDSIQDSIKIVDKERNIVFVNKAALDDIGKTIEKILGAKCYLEFRNRENPCPHCMMDETFRSGKAQHASFKTNEHKESFVSLEINTFPIKDSYGRVILGIEIVRDVSEREKMMHELVQTKTLAMLGKYCAELTHELKNPLNSINIQTLLIQRASEKLEGRLKHEIQDSVCVVKEEINRLNNLSQQYLQITKSPPIECRTCSLQKTIKEVITLVQPLIEVSKIDLKAYYAKEPITVIIDCDKMKQVFLNIINNAVESMQEGGTLTIATRYRSNSACIQIDDTGIGISSGNEEKIFQPFFSTKKSGTGLGLTLAKNIVTAHGGSIRVRRKTKGTTFLIDIPALPK